MKRSFLFPFPLFSFLIVIAALLYWIYTQATPDREGYAKLMEEKQPAKLTHRAAQSRKRIQKEAVFPEEGKKLILKGREGLIRIDTKEGKSAVVETMEHVSGVYEDGLKQYKLKAQSARLHYRTQIVELLEGKIRSGKEFLEVSRAVIDPKQQKIVGENPSGLLAFENRAGSGVVFRAGRVEWTSDHGTEVLTGSSDVNISEETLGSLTSETELKMVRRNGELVSIKGTEKNRLVSPDGFMVLAPGEVFADYEKKVVHLSSLENRQVFYEDRLGTLIADHIRIDLLEGVQGISAEKIVMEGNVRIENRFGVAGESAQYALADSVEYFPSTREMNFSSKKGKRVLFYDQINHLTVSAPGLHVKRDGLTDANTFKGVGDVRFNLEASELDQLKKRFSIYTKNGS